MTERSRASGLWKLHTQKVGVLVETGNWYSGISMRNGLQGKNTTTSYRISADKFRTISLPSNAISVLARPTLRSPQLLCASSIPYAIELADASSQEFTTFDAFRNPIHSIIRANEREESETFLAADSDRYINLYDATSHRLAKTLVAEFGVDSLATSKGDEVLGAITNNGLVQLFKTPFAARSSESDTTPKKSKRQGPSRPNASVRLVRPSSSTPIPLLSASFDGPDLVIAWVESGVHLNFDRIRWQAEDSESLAFEGIKDIVRGKPSSLLNSVTTNGVHDVGKTFVDDSQAVVTSGSGRLVDGESTGPLEEDEDIEEEEEDDDEDDEGEEDEAARQLTQEDAESSESSAGEDEEMVDAPSAPEPQEQVADEEATEPSFGELLASKHTQPIPISTTTDLTTIPTSTTVPATLQSGLSLSTVLTQALRTSDTQLLETCLHTTDPSTIRLTIQRLPSALAATLLSKLADRLSRRPGRYGHLLVWVQWTCVAHGGAIAGRKDVLSKIQSLFSVLNQRAKSLDNLLLLKGKLDMLDAQIGLRRQMMAERAQARSKSANRALEDEEDVIYIEGQDEESSASSSDEDDEEPVKHPRKKALQDLIGDEEDDEDMPMANSVASPSSSNNPQSGMIDDEAEESSAEGSQVDDASSSEEDDDEEEDDSEMNSFINDDEDSISEVEDSEDEITSEPETRPVKKLEGKA